MFKVQEDASGQSSLCLEAVILQGQKSGIFFSARLDVLVKKNVCQQLNHVHADKGVQGHNRKQNAKES